MGVHGLWRLLDTFGEVTQPSEWRGKRVAIDASIWMSQFRAKCKSGENMEQCVLEGFFLRILKLLFYGIEPVFVFDGSATDLKSTERRRRAERRAALERSALTRRAQQIVKAQLASGVLNVQALDQKSPVKTTDVGMLQRLSSTNISDTATGCFSTNSRSLLRKRRREIVLEPDVISRTLTNSFLAEAEEWIEERKRGEMCVEANLLFYSSTSLFMGPRRVLEGKIDGPIVPAVLPEKDTNPSAYMSLSSLSSEEASLVTSDDEKNSNNDYETVSTGITSSRDSVVIVGGHTETLPDRLREMEEITIHSLQDDSCDTWLEKDMATSDDIISFCSEGDGSCGSGHSNSDHDDSVQLWNPGTQLICQSGAETTRMHREVSNEGIERLTTASLGSVEQKTTEGTSSPVTKDLTGAVDVTRSLEAPSPSHPPQTFLPKPITKSTKAHQVIPFELLEILELLDCCGIPFVLSPHEADAQCAFLSQQRLVDAVFSEDSDVIVHGATVVLRGFFSKNRYVVVYRQSDLAMCGVDKDVLVALALLLGCDYAEGVDGVSLLEALRIIAAFWHQESVQGPSHVLDMLTRWRDAVVQRRFVWEEEGVLLQSYLNWRKWSTLRVAADFPQVPVVDAFFNATVDADMRAFAVASPDWNRLRTFAGMHGLLGDVTCQQRLELAQKAFMARELQRNNERKQQQLRLTDFAMPSHAKERVVYKKQPPKFAAALTALRAVRKSGACVDCCHY
ncbi:DNA repair protein RAD2, putative [Trypanosoma cruzi marinkellei]|uniref:DNA repair protein RAD2, putative n=1 Tax=Trypanosoma cruzi marinkellei TaxID=85056 RepID=K2MXB5_TRYCR|nr:DNA repair protein RAD2, putative [Trypanosoma cruzi marinkellei]